MEELLREMNENIARLREELRLNDNLEEKIQRGEFSDKILSWSHGGAYYVQPFYSELVGYSPDKMLKKEPKSKKNATCYFGGGEKINKIINYNSRAEIENVEYIFHSKLEVFSVVKDFRGGVRSLTKLIFDEDGKNKECYLVHDDDAFWWYHYIYDGDIISKIIVVSHDDIEPYGFLFLDYDTNGEVEGIYFNNGNEKVYIYSTKK